MRVRARLVAALAAPALGVSLLVGPGAAGAAPAEEPAPGGAGGHGDSVDPPEDGEPDEIEGPLVFGHRGASGYRPEHTLAAYRLAIAMGADYIEPDLVATKDGVLVARHENEISGTTDVEMRPEFADRKTTKTIDGTEYTGWFTEDFTLAELKTLRAEERIPDIRQENTLYNGRYQIPTFDEVIELAQAESERRGRTIGIAPETKHPTYHRSIGLPLERRLVRDLDEADWDDADDPVVIQSFETSNLRALDWFIDVPLVQLIMGSGAPADYVAGGRTETYDDLLTDEGLAMIASYADWIGPDKGRIVPRTTEGALLDPTDLVERAHEAGLKVVPYTFRNENTFLPLEFRRDDPATPGPDPENFGDAFAEYGLFYSLGVDGVFSDNPDTAVEAREAREAREAWEAWEAEAEVVAGAAQAAA